jgi:sphingolipid delta-4 desaturase
MMDSTSIASSFITSSLPEPHLKRRKELLEKYPVEARKLMGNYPFTFFWVLLFVITQFTIAYLLKDKNFIWILLTAYLVGATLSHALYVFMHEASHNLIFKSSVSNRLAGIFCDTALVVPGAMAFRKYHLLHHAKQGQFDYDADLCSEAEANLIGNAWYKKLVWVAFMGISQALRPMRLKNIQLWDRWVVTNLVIQIAVVITAYTLIGWTGLSYLLASTLFGLGIHPLGGRWIAEHYVVHEHQETYSYYGPLNKVAFNIGYHNEHHDIMTIPWAKLPQLKALDAEYYQTLHSHASYPGLLVNFIFNPQLSLKSRVIRN